MPKFYFDIDDGVRNGRDEDGLMLGDAHAAKLEALRALPDLAREIPSDCDQWVITVVVREDGGKAIFRGTLTITSEVFD